MKQASIFWIWSGALLWLSACHSGVVQAAQPIFSQAGHAAASETNANADTGPRTAAEQNSIEPETGSQKEELDLLEFVGKYQPRLRDLMDFLRRSEPDQYRLAVKEMGRVKQRLTNLEKRDHELFEVELQLWKTRSELRMVAAELSVASEKRRDSLEKQLEELADTQVRTELSKLKLQRQRLAQQIEQYDQQIIQRKQDQAENAARIVKQWKNRIARQSPEK